MTSLQECDLESKSIHIIKGHGLCRLAIEIVNFLEEDYSIWEQEIKMYNIEQVTPTNVTMSWYIDVQQYLEHDTLPSHLFAKQKREIHLKALSY